MLELSTACKSLSNINLQRFLKFSQGPSFARPPVQKAGAHPPKYTGWSERIRTKYGRLREIALSIRPFSGSRTAVSLYGISLAISPVPRGRKKRKNQEEWSSCGVQHGPKERPAVSVAIYTMGSFEVGRIIFGPPL